VGCLITFHYTFTAESDGERILKIDQHLAKLWAVRFFYETRCIVVKEIKCPNLLPSVGDYINAL